MVPDLTRAVRRGDLLRFRSETPARRHCLTVRVASRFPRRIGGSPAGRRRGHSAFRPKPVQDRSPGYAVTRLHGVAAGAG